MNESLEFVEGEKVNFPYPGQISFVLPPEALPRLHDAWDEPSEEVKNLIAPIKAEIQQVKIEAQERFQNSNSEAN